MRSFARQRPRVTPTAVTFPNGTHVAEVEIDPETGTTQIVGFTAVDEIRRHEVVLRLGDATQQRPDDRERPVVLL